MKYFDVTVPISPKTPVWPTDPTIKFSQFKSLKRGDHSNLLRVEFGTHSGTHIDAPHHIGLRKTIDKISPEQLIGPALVVEVKSKDAVRLADMKGVNLKKVRRVLFKTRNSSRPGNRFHRDFVYISDEAARALAKAGVLLVAIDAMSVDPFKGEGFAHKTLLKAGVVVVENVNLRGIAPGSYEMFCLPLKLTGADGAPARVILQKG